MNRTVGSIRYGFVGFVLEKLSDKRSENLLAAHASFLKEFFFFYFFVLSQRSPSSFPMLSQRCPETRIT